MNFDLSVPDIGSSVSSKERAILNVKTQLKSIVGDVVQKYCPDRCLLSNVDVMGNLVSADEAEREGFVGSIHDKSSGQYLKIEDANVIVAFSQRMTELERSKIEELIMLKSRIFS